VHDVQELQTGLIQSPWLCIPVMVAHPAVLSVDFSDDGTGRTSFERAGAGVMTTFFDVDWEWQVEPAEDGPRLNIQWALGDASLIDFAYEAVEMTVHNRLGKATTFTKKLAPSRHLFPLHSDFPDGWPVEYFGYPN